MVSSILSRPGIFNRGSPPSKRSQEPLNSTVPPKWRIGRTFLRFRRVSGGSRRLDYRRRLGLRHRPPWSGARAAAPPESPTGSHFGSKHRARTLLGSPGLLGERERESHALGSQPPVVRPVGATLDMSTTTLKRSTAILSAPTFQPATLQGNPS